MVALIGCLLRWCWFDWSLLHEYVHC